jgi:hypothetical protein
MRRTPDRSRKGAAQPIAYIKRGPAERRRVAGVRGQSKNRLNMVV